MVDRAEREGRNVRWNGTGRSPAPSPVPGPVDSSEHRRGVGRERLDGGGEATRRGGGLVATSGKGQGVGLSAAPSQVINLDEAWSQPLGPLDLVALELDGAALSPAFSPTVIQYEAFPQEPSQATVTGGGAIPRQLLVIGVVAEPARRGTTVQVASPTGEVDDLGHGRHRFRGRGGRDHHLTITVGRPEGPSRTTVVALRRAPVSDRDPSRGGDGVA